MTTMTHILIFVQDQLIGEVESPEQIEKFTQNWFVQHHGIVIPEKTLTMTEMVSSTPDTIHILVIPPSRTFVWTYPFHVLENEFANQPLLTEQTPIVIWMNPSVASANTWDVLTYEWNAEEGLPQFRDHVVSNENLLSMFEIYPPTMEVRQRYSFLNGRLSHSRDEMVSSFEKLCI